VYFQRHSTTHDGILLIQIFYTWLLTLIIFFTEKSRDCQPKSLPRITSVGVILSSIPSDCIICRIYVRSSKYASLTLASDVWGTYDVHTVMELLFEARSEKLLHNSKLYVKCWERSPVCWNKSFLHDIFCALRSLTDIVLLSQETHRRPGSRQVLNRQN